MFILFWFGPVVVGFLLGYYLSVSALIALSLTGFAIGWIFRPKREQEIGALLGVIVVTPLTIGLISAWLTYLFTEFVCSDGSNISEFIGQYLLR